MNGTCALAPLLGWRILVVEDEVLLAMLVEDTLTNAGAVVLGPATTVEAALALVGAADREGGLNAAVLDLNLGGDNVLPVCKALEAIGVPYIFATGYAENNQPWRQAPVPTLVKPYDPQELVRLVRSLEPAT